MCVSIIGLNLSPKKKKLTITVQPDYTAIVKVNLAVPAWNSRETGKWIVSSEMPWSARVITR